jgi:hypothetical protein
MNSQEEFNNVITRIGFDTNDKRNEITDQGITTCDDFSDLSKEEFTAIFEENKNQNRRRTLAN